MPHHGWGNSNHECSEATKTMDQLLLEVLACPCPQHARVEPDDAAAPTIIICQQCATTFPVRDGIPVMLLTEATPGPRGIGS